jgi:hypothetical protein
MDALSALIRRALSARSFLPKPLSGRPQSRGVAVCAIA